MFDRRNFLKTGATGLAGLGLSQSLLGQEKAEKPSLPPPPKKVLQRTLGKTGIKLPVVSMGVMNAENPALVKAAFEAGLVHFDTAHGYQRGRNEEMLGQVFKGVPRDKFVLATKVVWPGADRRTGAFTEANPEDFIALFHTSLKRLQLDHVDILYLHNVMSRDAALFEPALKVMQQLKKEGKVRHLGITTHKNEPEVIRAAIESKVYEVVLTRYNFLMANIGEVQKACAEAAKAGLGLVAMKTQAGVFFDKEKTKPINMRAALKWALQDPNLCTAIPGFTTFDQLKDDLAVLADPRLTHEEKASLEPPKAVAGLFCQACGRCEGQCVQGLPIPTLMRGYMYAAGYRNLAHAKDLVDELGLPESPCGDCGACAVRCASGFDVRPRVEDLLQLRGIDDRFLV